LPHTNGCDEGLPKDRIINKRRTQTVLDNHHNMTDILTKVLPRETFVRFLANSLNPDDSLPPISQNEGE
jgi:hypothetical protein